MISPISSASIIPQAELQAKPAVAQASANPASLAPDTVNISAKGAAAAASGDVDHDGDSH
jgi:hypothetical protein